MVVVNWISALTLTRSRTFIYLVVLIVYLFTLLWFLNRSGYLIIHIDVRLPRGLPSGLAENDGSPALTDIKEHFKEHGPGQVSPGINGVFFTIKTTPKNYKARIGMSKMTWFQKVERSMVCL